MARRTPSTFSPPLIAPHPLHPPWHAPATLLLGSIGLARIKEQVTVSLVSR